MEVGSYALSSEDKAFGFKVATESFKDVRYLTFTLIFYNAVYWLEFQKKVKDLT